MQKAHKLKKEKTGGEYNEYYNEGSNEGAERGASRQPAVGINPQIAFGFLLGLSGLAVVVGVWQMQNVIQAPFARLPQEIQEEATAQEPVDLRAQDTDADGLNDYDETFVYNTSPYLPDTDSDGFSDKEEIDSGNDPLCPAGQDCRGLVGEFSAEDKSADVEIPFLEGEGPVVPEQEAGEGEAFDINSVTPEQLRALLLESGQVDEEMLSQVSDEALMELFRQTVLQSGVPGVSQE